MLKIYEKKQEKITNKLDKSVTSKQTLNIFLDHSDKILQIQKNIEYIKAYL